MIYQIVFDEGIVKTAKYPAGFEKEMVAFLKKHKVHGRIYSFGKPIARF